MTCRFCRGYQEPLFRYGIRHYCHAECGFNRWGIEFLKMIPKHQVGLIPYRLILDFPDRKALAEELMGSK